MGHVEEKTMVPGELAPSRFVHTCLIVPFAMARPTLCTPDISAEICDRIAGGASLREIARDRTMPCVRTISRWIVHNDDFYHDYIRARQAQAHVIADEILELIYNLTEQIPEGQAAMPTVIARKSQLDALRWYLKQMLPKEFGEQPLLSLNTVNTEVRVYLPKKDDYPGIEGQATLVDQSAD
jgi:hypothetical protein